MTSIQYDEIFTRFYTKVEAFDFLYETMSNEMLTEYMHTWLYSAVSYPYIRRLFKTITLNNEAETIDFELAYETDEVLDKHFVIEILAYAAMYAWLEPKVHSITNIVQNFATSEQKYYSQASHLSELRALLQDAESRIRLLIRDRGYLNNSYLDGKALSANLRRRT